MTPSLYHGSSEDYHAKMEAEKEARDREERSWANRFLRFVTPLHVEPKRDDETEEEVFLEEIERAPDFLELFYDLVIVAVLSVFSGNHEVSSPQSVIVYFSYFVIIWWVWLSQSLYDVHFQANDWLHRLFKFAQLGAFAFVGATSGTFNPFEVVYATDDGSTTAVVQNTAADSFKGVAIAYAVGRILLIAQYLLVAMRLAFPSHLPPAFDPHLHKRRVVWVMFPCIVYLISAVFWFAAAFLTGVSSTKLGLAYTGLGLEVVSAVVLPLVPGFVKPPAALISERFGALSLIILGEGIIGLVRSFSFVISGFGFTNGAYLQCFCALAIAFTSWHFLFHGLNPERPMKRRTGTLWLIVHLPLHFIILLLFAGMRNAGSYTNINNAAVSAMTNLFDVVNAIENNTLPDVASQYQWLTTQLGKLDLDTPWPQEFAYINQSIVDPEFPHDPQIATYSYIADILVSVTDSFQIDLSEDVMDTFYTISNFNDTYITDAAQRNETEALNLDELDDFVQDYLTELAQGVLFFLPASGGLLLLAAFLQLLRTRPLGKWMWTYWFIQVVVAIGLCLLGLLDLGNKTYPLTGPEIAVYSLLDADWMLPTVALVYAVLILLESCMLLLAKRFEPEPVRPRFERGATEGSEGASKTELVATPYYERTGSTSVGGVPRFEGQTVA